LILQHFPRTKIDGATFWLNDRSPVIAMSLRYDRIDCFWHTLGHELGHISRGDAHSVDTDMVGAESAKQPDKQPEKERRADRFASEFLIPHSQLGAFIQKNRPKYSKREIRGFARACEVHPGIVVGQLQHRRQINYTHSREMLVKVRHIATKATLTDGWGSHRQLAEYRSALKALDAFDGQLGVIVGEDHRTATATAAGHFKAGQDRRRPIWAVTILGHVGGELASPGVNGYVLRLTIRIAQRDCETLIR
jgi:hypothetical protein